MDVKKLSESLNAIEALGIMQEDANEGSSVDKKAAKIKIQELRKTDAGRKSLEQARKDLGLDVEYSKATKERMMDGGMVKKKKTAKKMMGGGKVYARGSRKAKYNG